MLSSLFGKKSDHPMSDLKSAQALIAELSQNDPHRMLAELTDWMESVGDNAEFRADHQFAVLGLLDEAAQPCARKLMREYFSPQELGKLQENRLWLALGHWSYHAASAYLAVFDRCCGDIAASGMKPRLPLLAARTAHMLRIYLKFVSTHYGPTDPQLWHKVARLYRHAESNQYLDASVAPYPGSAEKESSVRMEIARLLGWHGCGVDTLRPVLMHLTECIVGQYCDGMALGPQQTADSLFRFDLDAPAAPLRVNAGVQAGSSMRFLGMAAMRPGLEALLAELAKGRVPPDLNLGGSYDVEPVRDAAQFLLDYLNSPPLRRSPRRGIRVSLSVASGLAGILHCVDPDARVRPEQLLQWEVEDISASGFRTVSPMRLVEGVRIGNLFGFRPEGVPQWGVAVVRRLTCDEANRMHVGAEKLGSNATVVTLSEGRGAEGGGAVGGLNALWLRAWSGETAGEVRLVMRAETFHMQSSLRTNLGGRDCLLLPLRLEERGGDYDLARFRAVEQQAGES